MTGIGLLGLLAACVWMSWQVAFGTSGETAWRTNCNLW